ncbi:MAG: quinol:cytochrome C oxidoreductase [Bacteroidetes bacterium]|nr:quinol:cytochrome C oxidoreductase [Bacteroidota bacterium]
MYTVAKNTKTISFALMAIGLIALIYGFATDAHRAWPSLMINNYFFLAIAAFAIFFVALQFVSEAAWAVTLQRVAEGISSYFIIGGVVMLFIIFGGAMHWNHIWHWMADGIMDPNNEHYDAIIAGKEAYLNVPFFFGRAVVYIFGWWLASRKLRQLSANEDAEGGLRNYKKSITISAIFIGFFGYTSSMMAWDWIMSIDTHWFSTLFGWFVFSSMGVTGFTMIAMIAIYLKRKGYLEHVNSNHIHDLGKWIFSFSVLWTYLWFSQFMLIWYSNIPEEVTYYMARWDNYNFLFWATAAINFIFPLLLLMSRDGKRNFSYIMTVGTIVLIGHWFNVFLLIAPGTLLDHWHIGFIEIGMAAGFLGLFLYVVHNALTKSPLLPKNHPFADESIHHHI